MRDGAILAIVLVTDELDCSYDKAWSDIFLPSGNHVFWSDPNASFPSSALCWNAGVECFGDPSQYDTCEPIDRNIEGQPSGPDEAVLHPISRYRDRLQSILDAKLELNPDMDLQLALIGGVRPDGTIVYADVDQSDPEFQLEFGIGPGCTGPLGEAALPPVRIRALVDEFTPGNLHSICATDYTGALQGIADAIGDQILPACYSKCAADHDPDTTILEPNCRVDLTVPGKASFEVPECLRDAQGAYASDPTTSRPVMPNDAVDACFATRVDAGMLSADPLDDLSAYCVESGFNLEFDLVFRPGVLPPAGHSVTATCDLADEPSVDCPALG